MQYKSYEEYMREFLGYGNEKKTVDENVYNRSQEEIAVENSKDVDTYQKVYDMVAPLITDVVEKTVKNVTEYIIAEVKKQMGEKENRQIASEESKQEIKETKNISQKKDLRDIEQDVRKNPICGNNSNKNMYSNQYMNRFRKF